MKSTSWTEATQSPFVALAGLLSCLTAGKNAWIESQTNGEQSYPVTVPNPLLDNPFNWTMSYGSPGDPPENQQYVNETHRDLTLNWTACFGQADAIEAYANGGKLTKPAIEGMGKCFPCRKADFLALRTDLKGWTFKELWTTYWKPVEGIPYRVPAPIGKVFVICFNDEPFDQRESLLRASAFLAEAAK